MDITINESDLHAAVTSATENAVTGALKSYNIESAIRDRVVDSLLTDAIANTVADSLNNLDVESLQRALAAEISRTVVATTVTILREAAVGILLDMRKIPNYDDDRRKRERISILREMGVTVAAEPPAADDGMPL